MNTLNADTKRIMTRFVQAACVAAALLAALPLCAAETPAKAEDMVANLLGGTAAPPEEADLDIPIVTDLPPAAVREAPAVPNELPAAPRAAGAPSPAAAPRTIPFQGTAAAPAPEGGADADAEVRVVGVPTNEAVQAEEPEVPVDSAVARKDAQVISLTITAATNEDREVRIDTSTAPTQRGATGAAAVAVAAAAPGAQAEAAPLAVLPGTLVGKVTDHAGRPMENVKVVLFNDNSYNEMPTTPHGNFGFSVRESNTYTLTATFGNQFQYTNICLLPARAYYFRMSFVMPVTVYGQLLMDGKPAQYGLLLRLIGEKGGQAGGIVLSNGIFRIVGITPGAYTMVCERRKRFIDRRINESRFYYLPIVLTTETARITFQRDRRSITGKVILDGLPRRHVDALIALNDAKTGGQLVHREVYTYYQEGYFVFDNVAPGTYTLQATQTDRLWKSRPVTCVLRPTDKSVNIQIDIVTDTEAERRRLLNLRKQFLTD